MCKYSIVVEKSGKKYQVGEAETIDQFIEFVRQQLADDVSGDYRQVRYKKTMTGRYLDLTLAKPSHNDIVSSLPKWYDGPGWYDQNDNAVLLDSETSIDELRLGDYRYKMVVK